MLVLDGRGLRLVRWTRHLLNGEGEPTMCTCGANEKVLQVASGISSLRKASSPFPHPAIGKDDLEPGSSDLSEYSTCGVRPQRSPFRHFDGTGCRLLAHLGSELQS